MNKVTSLKTAIVFRLIIPVMAFIVFETALSYFVTLHYVDEAYDRWLLDSARSLLQEVKVIDDEIYIDLPPSALEIFKWDDVDTTFFKIITENKEVLAGDLLVPESLISKYWKQPVFSDETHHGEAIRMVSIRVPGNMPENVTIHVAETLNKRQDMMIDILIADLIPQLFLSLLVSLFLFKGVKGGLAPLHQLEKDISQRSPSDLSPISDTHVFKEVKTLTDTINNLFAKLSIAIAAQQRFIANAAHQLRTPLTGLKLQADRAQREDSIQAMRPALSQIQNSADRASHMITQLLALTRSDPIQGSQLFESIDLRGLTRDSCIEWVPKALKKNIELSYEAPEQALLIKGDKVLLAELLNNLLDNAITYGHKHGNILVSLTNLPYPCMTVEDSGPGIHSTECDKIFERFYRIPGSPGNGCGLGLAIVKEIAVLHQIKLKLGHSTLGGTRIELQFGNL